MTASSPINRHRFQVLLTDTPGRGNDLADLELRHRQHARVEGRIRHGKDRGMRNLRCQDWHTSRLARAHPRRSRLHDLGHALCFTGTLGRVEAKRFLYRALHIAGRLARTGRRLILRLDQDWPWATDLAQAPYRLRAAPWPG